MKKTTAILTLILLLSSISSLCLADGCKTSTGQLKNCGDSWEDVSNGVKTHCDCVCVDISCIGSNCYNSPPVCYEIPVSANTSGSSGGSGTLGSAKTNMNSDVEGTAFFSRNALYETGDWADDNSRKWDAFESRVLENGYGNISSFINTSADNMPFNDFVYQATIKYLNNNYFNNGSGDSRLVRDDSTIPNASFYTGNGSNAAPVITPNPAGGGGSPKLPAGFEENDMDGVYIQGSLPEILGGGNITVEESERMRLNSVIDHNGVVNAGTAQIQVMQDETAAKQEKSNELISALSEGIGTATDPGSDYYAEEIGKKAAGVIGGGEEIGETGGSIAGILTGVYNIGKDFSKGDVTGALSELPGGVVALLPEELSGAGGVAVSGGAVYTYFAGRAGDNAVENINKAASTLTGTNVDVTGGKSFSETANEAIHENIEKLKEMIFEKKNLDGTY
jgi:hypothetical protein